MRRRTAAFLTCPSAGFDLIVFPPAIFTIIEHHKQEKELSMAASGCTPPVVWQERKVGTLPGLFPGAEPCGHNSLLLIQTTAGLFSGIASYYHRITSCFFFSGDDSFSRDCQTFAGVASSAQHLTTVDVKLQYRRRREPIFYVSEMCCPVLN